MVDATIIQNLRNDLDTHGLSAVAVSALYEITCDEEIAILTLIGNGACVDSAKSKSAVRWRRLREALLLLLLASMVNADEPVDAASFHAHVTAKLDVELVFVNRLGVAPTSVCKGDLRD
ncbi:hypothetical protein HK405_006071 [Cladochytrium tenue]|nr:hypothetical protein HK405_006071 [Cladochytrium tenue]